MRRLLCSAAAAVFALCATASAQPAPTAAEACQAAHAHNRRVGPAISDPRVETAILAAIKAADFNSRVVACEINMPYLNAMVEDGGGYYYVGLTKMLIERFDDEELRAALGHELAHVVLGHRKVGFELTHHRTARYEREADALSARWFGKAPMHSVLEKLLADARKLPLLQQHQAVAEIEARIQALDQAPAASPASNQ